MSDEPLLELAGRVDDLAQSQSRMEAKLTNLEGQVGISNRVLMGFLADDNKMHPGLVGRVEAVEVKMDMAIATLSRIGLWSVRLLLVLVGLTLLQALGMHPDWAAVQKALQAVGL